MTNEQTLIGYATPEGLVCDTDAEMVFCGPSTAEGFGNQTIYDSEDGWGIINQ